MTLQTDLLGKVSETLGSAHTVEQLTRPLLELLELVTGLESTYLTHIDTGAGMQTIVFSRNTRTMQIPEGLSVPWGDTLCKRALEEGRSYMEDVAACWGDSEAARALGIQTYASTPVYMGSEHLYGTLCAASSDRQPLTPQGKQALSLFSTLIGRQLERERLLADLQKANAALETESATDALTGLPNRRCTLAELDRLFALGRRTGQRVLVVFIDLDGFKKINDAYGHDAGDVFLVEVGRRLSNGLRAGDMLGRLGGDEFVVIGLTAPSDGDNDEAPRRRLAPLVQGSYDLGEVVIDYPGASFGVVHADPHQSNPDEALRAADARMYENKRSRRS